MIGILISLTLLTFVLQFFWSRRNMLILASKIEGNAGIPFIGVGHKFLFADNKKIWESFLEIFSSLKFPGKVWLGPELMFTIDDPETIKIVLNSKECLDKSELYKSFRMKYSSIFGSLDIWKRHRKVLNPSFKFQKLKASVPIFDEKSKRLIKFLDEKCDKGEFDIHPLASAFFLESTLSSLFDFDVDILTSDKREEYFHYFEVYVNLITERVTKPWLSSNVIYEKTNMYKREVEALQKNSLKFAKEILENARQKPAPKSEITENVIHALINPNNNLCEKEIIDEIKGLIAAGQDTSALSVATTLLMIAMHKNVQDKLVKELRDVIGFSNATEINNEILNQLPYLEMVIKETMRLFPVIPSVTRKLQKNFVLNGKTLPAGSNLLIFIYAIHRDPKTWGNDAHLFIPERFEPERIKDIHPYAFIPFTGGARICIGYKFAMLFIKTLIANFLTVYEVDTSLKFDELQFKFTVGLKLIQPYNISIKSRNNI